MARTSGPPPLFRAQWPWLHGFAVRTLVKMTSGKRLFQRPNKKKGGLASSTRESFAVFGLLRLFVEARASGRRGPGIEDISCDQRIRGTGRRGWTDACQLIRYQRSCPVGARQTADGRSHRDGVRDDVAGSAPRLNFGSPEKGPTARDTDTLVPLRIEISPVG